MNDTELPEYERAAELCNLLTIPAVRYLIGCLERGESTTRTLVCVQYKTHTVLKYLKSLIHHNIVRKETLGNSSTYKLQKKNHERIRELILTLGDIAH